MIRAGTGGWVYPAWRDGAYYPEGLPRKRELEWSSRQLGVIEINATYRKLQKPETFRQWREATPEGFMFAVKGSAFICNRKVLGGSGEALARFFGQGLEELGDRLGPIVWQLALTKRFEPDDIAAFFALLPRQLGAPLEGRPLRHAIEIGHESFACAEFVELAREAGVAIVWCEQSARPAIADRTADFAYLRCKDLVPGEPAGYSPASLARIAGLCGAWARGEAPAGLPYLDARSASERGPGDVFVFMINGAKERAPAAALALMAQLEGRE